jgi:PAS domain-containing protein
MFWVGEFGSRSFNVISKNENHKDDEACVVDEKGQSRSILMASTLPLRSGLVPLSNTSVIPSSERMAVMESTSTAPSLARARRDNPRRKIFDWISEPRPANITPFQQFILDIDWEKSPLGPMNKWPAQLRQMVLLVVQDPSPAVVRKPPLIYRLIIHMYLQLSQVYWGDDTIIVYNEAYTHLIGRKHPALQGQDPKIEFAEIWDHFEKLLATQRETAETIVEANALLLLNRHGFYEETYFTWKFMPIIGSEGWVVGSYATVVEATREVVADRRLKTVRELSRQLSASKSIKDLWSRLILGIEDADRDIPLAMLYSVADEAVASKISSKSQNPCSPASTPSTVCILEGSIGIPAGHAIAPSELDLADDHSCLISAFKKAMTEMAPVVIPVEEEPHKYFEGIKWRGFGVIPTQFVVCPIIPTDSCNVLAFLVIALNPRRPYDDEYRTFLQLLTQQVTIPQLSAVILREEIERRQLVAKQEALDRDRLYRELSDSETKFARFATRAPIGLAILKANGLAMSANELWRDLTMLEVGTDRVDWHQVLADGETELVQVAWDRLIRFKKPITMQTRIRRPWRAPDLDSDGKVQYGDTHILLAMYPDVDENDEVTTVMSCITDIR